jgi:4-aminobutyrate aminotransferase-like enzyme
VQTQQGTETERVVASRGRYVARGIATTDLVVARAEGARIWDLDGREYVDFAGGIACQNTGHGLVLLSCGVHGNVVRVLPPILVPDDDLERGLDILEESLADADRAGA